MNEVITSQVANILEEFTRILAIKHEFMPLLQARLGQLATLSYRQGIESVRNAKATNPKRDGS